VPGEERETADDVPVSEEPVTGDVEAPVDPRDEKPVCETPVDETPPPLPPEEEAAPAADGVDTQPAPEVVDTIPDDDDCAS